MKSNFNVFFFVFTSIFLLSFLPFICFFLWNFIFEKDDWLQNMKSIFSSFFLLFFHYFLLTFSPFKICFSSQIERNCRVSKLKQGLRSWFLMIFGHFYHVYVFFGSKIERNGPMTKLTPVLRSRFLMIFWSFSPCVRIFWL